MKTFERAILSPAEFQTVTRLTKNKKKEPRYPSYGSNLLKNFADPKPKKKKKKANA